MDVRSATKAIKGLSPQNISGVLKPSLDMFEKLKRSEGNKFMEMAVGPKELMDTMKGISDLLKGNLLKQVAKTIGKQLNDVLPNGLNIDKVVDGAMERAIGEGIDLLESNMNQLVGLANGLDIDKAKALTDIAGIDLSKIQIPTELIEIETKLRNLKSLYPNFQ